MKHHKSLSLSLQREMETRNLAMDSEILKAFQELKITSLLRRSAIIKRKGYVTFTLLYLIILLPFLKKYLTSLWLQGFLIYRIEAQKDTYYRFLNHERYNWRRFINLLVTRLLAMIDDVPLRQKVLIGDDTITYKTGSSGFCLDDR